MCGQKTCSQGLEEHLKKAIGCRASQATSAVGKCSCPIEAGFIIVRNLASAFCGKLPLATKHPWQIREHVPYASCIVLWLSGLGSHQGPLESLPSTQGNGTAHRAECNTQCLFDRPCRSHADIWPFLIQLFLHACASTLAKGRSKSADCWRQSELRCCAASLGLILW